MLCDRLGGGDGEGGREGDAGGRRYGNVCICVADSLCYKAETNTHLIHFVIKQKLTHNCFTIVKQLYFNKDV